MLKKKFKTIGMVVAMEKEVKPFFEKFGKGIKEISVGGYTVFKCKINGKKIYLIKSGIGEIYASAATEILISLFKCDLILNFGVCGSLKEDISVYETVVVSGVVHYDFDLSKIDGTKVGQYPNYDVVIKTNESLVDFVLSLNSEIKPAICASADKFVADEVVKENLVKEFNADVCDMECAAVLLTSLTANVPALIIKAVSDGKGGAEEFTRRVNKASEAYLDTLKNIIERI